MLMQQSVKVNRVKKILQRNKTKKKPEKSDVKIGFF